MAKQKTSCSNSREYALCPNILFGVHKAWITIETATREQARDILPPAYRAQVTIVQLNKFSMGEIEEILKHHGKK